MFKKSILISLATAALLLFTQRAHSHHHDNDTKPDSCKNSHSLHSCTSHKNQPEIKNLAHLIHESITGEHSHFHSWKDFLKSFTQLKTWKHWLQGIKNLPNARLNYERALNHSGLEKQFDTSISQHAKNIFILYGAGELIEIFVIPTLGTAYIIEGEGSALTKSIIGGFSYLTALPGIEPVCGLIMACYFLSPPIQRATTWSINNSYRFVVSSYETIFNKKKTNYSSIEAAEEIFKGVGLTHEYKIKTQLDNDDYKVELVSLLEPNKPILSFNFAVNNYQSPLGWTVEASLTKLSWGNHKTLDPGFFEAANALGRVLGENVSSATNEALKLIGQIRHEELSNKFYVKSASDASGTTIVEFHNDYIFMKVGTTYNKQTLIDKNIANCERALSSIL